MVDTVHLGGAGAERGGRAATPASLISRGLPAGVMLGAVPQGGAATPGSPVYRIRERHADARYAVDVCSSAVETGEGRRSEGRSAEGAHLRALDADRRTRCAGRHQGVATARSPTPRLVPQAANSTESRQSAPWCGRRRGQCSNSSSNSKIAQAAELPCVTHPAVVARWLPLRNFHPPPRLGRGRIQKSTKLIRS